MNRFHTIRAAIVLMVMAIMTISSMFSCGILLGFIVVGAIELTPVILTYVMLMISLVVGSVLTVFVVKRFLKPMNVLIEANKRVAQGDFSVRVNAVKENVGEMSELQHSFNRMVRELQGIELFRTDFINNFSHEFKTPIVSIQGYAKQLKKSDLTLEQRNEFLDIIIKESERLSNMSSNVLQMSKLENQNMVTDCKRFSLDEQIRNVILMLECSWNEKNIHWELDLPAVDFYGNDDLTHQIWKNLLENAIKFTGENGTIGVDLAAVDQQVTITITDNGCGMDQEVIEHIFEKFYQGDPSRTVRGNGLGLSIVKRIVDLCNGTISVESQREKGSVFTVVLPNQLNQV